MKAIDTKQQLLDDAGFSYNFDREIYVNRKTKKVFSVEFIEDHDEKTLEECIRKPSGAKQWRFYFTSKASSRVIRDLEAELG